MGNGVVLAEVAHGIYLIFHQGDEGRDDNSGAVHEQSGELVTQGLATAGGHQHEGVAPVEEALNDSLLVALESTETEVTAQSVGERRIVHFLLE